MTDVTQDVIDCWRVNYGLDKTPHDLHAFWADRVPSGAALALKAACDEIKRLRGICASVHDGLLRGYDDRELIALAAQGWGPNVKLADL